MEKRIYLDYASSTPLDPQVLSAMQPYFYKLFGNPGSTHREGQIAFAALAEAREMISLALGAEWKNTLFLPSATEANNFILRGALSVWGKSHPGIIPEYIISPLEHPSLIATAKDLAREGKIILHFLKVTEAGIVDFTSLSPSFLLAPASSLSKAPTASLVPSSLFKKSPLSYLLIKNLKKIIVIPDLAHLALSGIRNL